MLEAPLQRLGHPRGLVTGGRAVGHRPELEDDPTAVGAQMAGAAAAFASMFRGWLGHIPVDDDTVAATRRFFVLHRRATEHLAEWVSPTATELRSRSSGPPPSRDSPESMARAAMEQVEKDRALRGSLSEAGSAPLLDWASGRALAAVVNLGVEIEAWDGVIRVASLLRRLVRAAVKAAETADAAGLLTAPEGCPRPVVDRDIAAIALARLPLNDDPDHNALTIVGALRGCHTAGSPGVAMMHPRVPPRGHRFDFRTCAARPLRRTDERRSAPRGSAGAPATAGAGRAAAHRARRPGGHCRGRRCAPPPAQCRSNGAFSSGSGCSSP